MTGTPAADIMDFAVLHSPQEGKALMQNNCYIRIHGQNVNIYVCMYVVCTDGWMAYILTNIHSLHTLHTFCVR